MAGHRSSSVKPVRSNSSRSSGTTKRAQHTQSAQRAKSADISRAKHGEQAKSAEATKGPEAQRYLNPSDKVSLSEEARQEKKTEEAGASGAGDLIKGLRSMQGSTGTEAAKGLPEGELVGKTRATGYYPHKSKLEGGVLDRKDKPLHTLQDYLEGNAPYVSMAIDRKLYDNGTVNHGDTFRIKELEEKYGRQIPFQAVDTGGDFTGKGFSRIDICTRNKAYSEDSAINRELTLMRVSDD
jgi:hypothetical protein